MPRIVLAGLGGAAAALRMRAHGQDSASDASRRATAGPRGASGDELAAPELFSVKVPARGVAKRGVGRRLEERG